MAFVATGQYYKIEDGNVVGSPYTRSSLPIGKNSEPWPDYGELWEDKPTQQLPYSSMHEGSITVNNDLQRCEKVWTEVDASVTEKRQIIADSIDSQVSEPTTRQLANDPAVERDVVREEAAAEDKRIELQNAADEELDTFDPTITVAPVQNGVEYSRVTGIVLELEPWAGTPDNIYGPVVELEVQSGLEDQGAQARMNITMPDNTVIPSLTFTQRTAPEDNVWDLSYPQDRQWADQNGVAYMELLWGAGSVAVSRKMKLDGYGKRAAQSVRYGVAGAQAKKRRIP